MKTYEDPFKQIKEDADYLKEQNDLLFDLLKRIAVEALYTEGGQHIIGTPMYKRIIRTLDTIDLRKQEC